MSSQEFNALPLHDAVLGLIEVQWQDKVCRIQLAAFTDRAENAKQHFLEFHGVTGVVISQMEPWGPSLFVLAGTQSENVYRLQMQSGDNIEVTANGFAFIAR